jgi:4-hydroxy-tetrahydrodipicolinate synthase
MPGRTSINFTPESVYELCSKVDNVKAIKEASGDINQMMRVIELCGDKIDLLSGDDNLILPVLSFGGKGVVSVLSNILPAEVKNIITLFNEGKIDESRKAFYRLLPLCRAMFTETNPIPIKAAMAMIGQCEKEVRLPLVTLAEDKVAALKAALQEYGVQV